MKAFNERSMSDATTTLTNSDIIVVARSIVLYQHLSKIVLTYLFDFSTRL